MFSALLQAHLKCSINTGTMSKTVGGSSNVWSPQENNLTYIFPERKFYASVNFYLHLLIIVNYNDTARHQHFLSLSTFFTT